MFKKILPYAIVFIIAFLIGLFIGNIGKTEFKNTISQLKGRNQHLRITLDNIRIEQSKEQKNLEENKRIIDNSKKAIERTKQIIQKIESILNYKEN